MTIGTVKYYSYRTTQPILLAEIKGSDVVYMNPSLKMSAVNPGLSIWDLPKYKREFGTVSKLKPDHPKFADILAIFIEKNYSGCLRKEQYQFTSNLHHDLLCNRSDYPPMIRKTSKGRDEHTKIVLMR